MVGTDEKPENKPASENIWYALMTIVGEPKTKDDPIIQQNKSMWHHFLNLRLQPNAKEGLRLGDYEIAKFSEAKIEQVLREKGFETPIKELGCEVDFSNICFPKKVFLTGFIFPGNIDFTRARFEGNANFESAEFFKVAKFDNAIFEKPANFEKAIFCGFTSFKESIFKAAISFRSCIFKSTLRFTGSDFQQSPPKFYASNITEDISWEDTSFPMAPKNMDLAEHHRNTYECLALMMSKLEKAHDKHLFFRHEMRARRVLEGNWFSKSMNWVYDTTCEYGYSFERALGVWVAQIGIGAVLLFLFYPASKTWAEFANSVALSFANTHSFLGLNRGPLKTVYEHYTIWEWFNVIWILQALLGIILLFFLLLTIRNRFKMGD